MDMMDKKSAKKIFAMLAKEYSGATTELVYNKPHELLIATILSAQCTDLRVNSVTRSLFKKYRSVPDFAFADRVTLEQEIRSTGFFRSKAKHIIDSAKIIMKEFGGEVPCNMECLIRLPGVARKTANIVLFHGFGKIEGIAVDTHVKRVSHRLAFTVNSDPVKIERDLMSLFSKRLWGYLSNVLISHGRKVCRARKPDCKRCPVMRLCSFRELDKVLTR